jgi:hypothetical protein
MTSIGGQGMIYELWDTRSGNVVGTFETKEEALAIVRDAAADRGEAFAESFLLGQEDKAGRSRPIAEGKVLVALALGRPESEHARAS